MRKSRLIAPMLLGVGLIALPALLPEAKAALPQMQSPAPGMARVWFLRTSGLTDSNAGAAPMLFANGTPLAALPAWMKRTGCGCRAVTGENRKVAAQAA